MTSRRDFLGSTTAAGALATVAPLPALADLVTSPGTRAALVIGNARYRQNPLDSSTNDARAMAALFKDAGFAVDLRVDATREQMLAAIEQFGKTMASGGVTLGAFYYAGHAAQLDWRNYLLPVDGDVESAGDVRKQCVDLGVLLGHVGKQRGKTTLIILDACRDDPFGKRVRLPDKGLSQYDAPVGSLLAFATAPGRVAIEIAGAKHGLYTEHLLRELAVKGVRVEDALKRVRLAVRVASKGLQVPWESTSLESDLYLYPLRKLTEAELDARFKEEFTLWTRIKSSTQLDDWIQYLRRFPNGTFAEVAQSRTAQFFATPEAPRIAPAAAAKAPAAPALVLGAGRPVPAPLDSSGNPNSAGTYPVRPIWTPGDEYVFEFRDLYSGVKQRTHRFVVKRVDPANDRVEMSDGSVLDLFGSVAREGNGRVYDVPIQTMPAELQVGKTWVSRFQQTRVAPGHGEYRFRIEGRERVEVPAGRFNAFKIVGSGWFSAPGNSTSIRLTRWVVPGLNMPVRVELLQRTEMRVLVSAKQAVFRST